MSKVFSILSSVKIALYEARVEMVEMVEMVDWVEVLPSALVIAIAYTVGKSWIFIPFLTQVVCISLTLSTSSLPAEEKFALYNPPPNDTIKTTGLIEGVDEGEGNP